MTTNYDGIAKEYQASKLQPWRTHIERYTLLRLTGDVRGWRNGRRWSGGFICPQGPSR